MAHFTGLNFISMLSRITAQDNVFPKGKCGLHTASYYNVLTPQKTPTILALIGVDA